MTATTPARVLLAAVLLAVCAYPAAAQSPAETGTGGGPGTTSRAPNTTSVGQTKPPGSAAAPERPADRENRTGMEKKNEAIDTGICIGCSK